MYSRDRVPIQRDLGSSSFSLSSLLNIFAPLAHRGWDVCVLETGRILPDRFICMLVLTGCCHLLNKVSAVSKSENLDRFGGIGKHTVLPSLKQSQQLVLICSKSFSFQSLTTNSPSPCSLLPPQQTAPFPKPKSEILASVNVAHDVPGESSPKSCLWEYSVPNCSREDEDVPYCPKKMFLSNLHQPVVHFCHKVLRFSALLRYLS